MSHPNAQETLFEILEDCSTTPSFPSFPQIPTTQIGHLPCLTGRWWLSCKKALLLTDCNSTIPFLFTLPFSCLCGRSSLIELRQHTIHLPFAHPPRNGNWVLLRVYISSRSEGCCALKTLFKLLPKNNYATLSPYLYTVVFWTLLRNLLVSHSLLSPDAPPVARLEPLQCARDMCQWLEYWGWRHELGMLGKH